MKFFNREQEKNEVLNILKKDPDDIYFIYGPINSGKTALIKHIIENELDNSYRIFYINFRMYLIARKDFIEALFTVRKENFFEKIKDYSEVLDILIKGSKILTGVPIPEFDFNEMFNKEITNVFKYLNNVFLDIKKQGKKPVFILDELQEIKGITTNGQKELLAEFFQFLVSLTKEQHLCHVFCLSSDSLFINYVYNTGKLEGRAKYILVDDFDKETAFEFMEFLNPEISDQDKGKVYSYVGGKAKDIVYVINTMKYKDLDQILDGILNDEINRLKFRLRKLEIVKPKIEIDGKVIEINKEEIIDVLKLFKDQYEVSSEEIKFETLVYLIDENILFLDTQTGLVKPQSFLIWNAIKNVV